MDAANVVGADVGATASLSAQKKRGAAMTMSMLSPPVKLMKRPTRKPRMAMMANGRKNAGVAAGAADGADAARMLTAHTLQPTNRLTTQMRARKRTQVRSI